MAKARPTAMVNFVMKDGSVRPLLIVKVTQAAADAPEVVNGYLFIDGTNDHHQKEENLPANVREPVPGSTQPIWVHDISEDAEKNPGTWHWPSLLERVGA